jgi:hypothetical protein
VRFLFVCRVTLPRLAWGAVLEKGRGNVTVYHGEQVEIREDGFFEGVWNGPGEVAAALEATVACGTGGQSDDADVRFWTSTDNLYPLHSVAVGDRLFVSNSPVFAQVLARETPDPSYPFYYDDFIRLARRCYNAHGSLRTASGNRLRLHFGHVMMVDRNLNVSFSRHPACASFSDYESYYRLLASSVHQVLDNGASSSRCFPYKPLASCSGGYDANACAALAARAGCTEAITFTSSEAREDESDSGEHIADALNMRCFTADKRAFLDTADLSEFCIVPHSMYPTYSAFEQILAGRILVSGSSGGMIWSKGSAGYIDDGCISWLRFVSSYGLLEFRLRVGFLVFLPSRIGFIHNREILRINCSTEMKPWSVGNNYDRPIARRIIEEAGVDRRAFGMRKMASSQVRLDGPAVQRSAIGPAYRAFMEQRARQVDPVVDRYWRFRNSCRWFILTRLSSPRKRQVRYTRLRRMFSFLNNRPAVFEWYYLFAHQFSFNSLKARYVSPEMAGRQPHDYTARRSTHDAV